MPESELKEAQKRIRELERILGKQPVKVELLEEAAKITRKKVDLGRRLVEQGRWKVMSIGQRLGTIRSALYYQAEVRTDYDKQESDRALLERIQGIIGKRPAYGYRSVTAILKRCKKAAQVNHKRVFRVMRNARLPLPKFTGRAERPHLGKIMTLNRNTRCCSDGHGIRCWNGEKPRVAFALDCCERVAIG